jgi:hypothetical protein
MGTLVLGAASLASVADAQVGPPGGMVYASDQLFETVGTPTDLPARGQFDTIYALGNGFVNVAEAAPGEAGFNGGRWEVREVTFLTIAPTQFTNDEDILAAEEAGQISIGPVVRRFECPLIPVR